MKWFRVYVEEPGTWFEGKKRLDGVIDLVPGPKFLADSPQHALQVAKSLGHKNPIVGELNPTNHIIH